MSNTSQSNTKQYSVCVTSDADSSRVWADVPAGSPVGAVEMALGVAGLIYSRSERIRVYPLGTSTNLGDSLVDVRRATDEQLSALEQEAAAAGDDDQVAICKRALRGADVARLECERIIWRGATQA